MTTDVTIRENIALMSPADVVANATTQAKLLMDIVEKTRCYQQIRDKKYLQVEAWETIGAFNRTHSETESIMPITVDGEVIGYQAHVQLWKDGNVVGGAVMPCYFTENCCKGKDGDAKHKASMSAAQTFATSKAYRMNYSYIAILAGYQPTPAEEVTEDMKEEDKSHWCAEHNTSYFMRGKMKSYAHPIKDANGNDTGEWCHEHKEKPPVETLPEPHETHYNEQQAAEKPKHDIVYKRDPASLKKLPEAIRACYEDYGKQPGEVLEIMGVKTQIQINDTPAEVYRKVAEKMKG